MSVITAQPAKAVSQSKIVIAAIIGNLLEFFDFTVYSFFALTIAKLFFPAHDPVVSTLLALSAFAIGFVAHPVGSFVLDHYADKRGRRAALTANSTGRCNIPKFRGVKWGDRGTGARNKPEGQ
ncbi:MAG: Uncharacterized MFS-type transporter [Candidatus Burkholderia crenata]|nr:MAG: Uncharacterized MFS-type transporter [Candidatus Burkholderia crenata]